MGAGLVPADYQRMRSVAQAAISPDGKFVAYTVLRYDRPGRPWPQLWVLDVASGKSSRIGGEQDVAGVAGWSPDSRVDRVTTERLRESMGWRWCIRMDRRRHF